MGKLISLSRTGPASEALPSSDVTIALFVWLKHKATNTSRIYRGIASDWSRYLGAELEHPSAGKLWKRATHAQAQSYLLHAASRPAQSGRSARNHDRVSDATLRHKATVLFACYDELIAQGLVEANPFHRVRSQYDKAKVGERRPHERVDSDAVRKLLEPPDIGSLANLPPEFELGRKETIRNHALLCLLFGAALRRSEATKLTIGDVCATSSGTVYITLRDTKAGHERQEHTVADWIASGLKMLVTQRRGEGARDTDPLFVCYLGHGKPARDQISESTLYRVFKELCARVGLPESITPHCARVTAITRLLDQGVPHREVKEFSRHSSVVMVERYDRKRRSIEDSIAKKLEY